MVRPSNFGWSLVRWHWSISIPMLDDVWVVCCLCWRLDAVHQQVQQWLLRKSQSKRCGEFGVRPTNTGNLGDMVIDKMNAVEESNNKIWFIWLLVLVPLLTKNFAETLLLMFIQEQWWIAAPRISWWSCRERQWLYRHWWWSLIEWWCSCRPPQFVMNKMSVLCWIMMIVKQIVIVQSNVFNVPMFLISNICSLFPTWSLIYLINERLYVDWTKRMK